MVDVELSGNAEEGDTAESTLLKEQTFLPQPSAGHSETERLRKAACRCLSEAVQEFQVHRELCY